MLYWTPAAASGSFPFEGKTVDDQARIISSNTIYSGRVVTLKVERLVEPGGVETTREVVCHPGSVVVIPHLPDGRLILVRQYRHAAGESLWELVAGGLERGETPLEGARRELLEETGYDASRLKPIMEFFPSPGILTEKMHLFEAWDLTASQGHPDEDERIETGFFTLDAVLEMVRRNSIKDAKTLVGALWLANGASNSR